MLQLHTRTAVATVVLETEGSLQAGSSVRILREETVNLIAKERGCCSSIWLQSTRSMPPVSARCSMRRGVSLGSGGS